MLRGIFFIYLYHMKWYEIIIAILVILVGVYFGIKFKEHRKNMYHNNSWRKKQ